MPPSKPSSCFGTSLRSFPLNRRWFRRFLFATVIPEYAATLDSLYGAKAATSTDGKAASSTTGAEIKSSLEEATDFGGAGDGTIERYLAHPPLFVNEMHGEGINVRYARLAVQPWVAALLFCWTSDFDAGVRSWLQVHWRAAPASQGCGAPVDRPQGDHLFAGTALNSDLLCAGLCCCLLMCAGNGHARAQDRVPSSHASHVAKRYCHHVSTPRLFLPRPDRP